jgi:copper chaperone CopZ
MKNKFRVLGMTCGSCENSIKKNLEQLSFSNILVDRLNEEVSFDSEGSYSLLDLKDHLSSLPKFTVDSKLEENIKSNFIDLMTVENSLTTRIEPMVAVSKSDIEEAELSVLVTYKPLLIIVSFIIGIAYLITLKSENDQVFLKEFLHHVMTGFFLVFSFFKLLDVKGFASSFHMYDIVAKKFYFYGLLYPFLELAIGIACLMNWNVKYAYAFEIQLMALGLIGVIQSNLNKESIKCACLGNVFNLPMSKITIIENTSMILIGLYLLFF